ncbi:MAG: hypothetical protein UW24_C0012G0010 [Parcubacteria group bacterium GW2011_GWA2_44_12]|nr:MAG: hypothetical protein UW24_C0012G0010 [Parcubacteria group bacterium GW2011_GWA2_44_12]
MSPLITLKIAATGLRANKFRSILTILGIVIGITAIMLVMAVGSGANKLILSQVQGIGSNMLVVVPGQEAKGPSQFSMFFIDSLKEPEVKALRSKANVPTAIDVTPWQIVPGSISYKGETFQPTTFGTTEQFAEVMSLNPIDGRFFTEDEVQNRANVAVIGTNVKEELFGSATALEEKVKIKGTLFRVVGILPQKGNMLFFNVDDLVAIPYTSAETYLTGKSYFNEIIVRAENESLVDRTVYDISLTLREIHGITNTDKDDFHIHTQKDLVDRIGLITGIMTALLSSIAAISLIVGGIGIMNIMLVSVTERTREIGLRKAVGATDGNIMGQFLLEAMLLTGIGGILGVLGGALLSFATSLVLSKMLNISWEFTFPLNAALLGIGVSS